MRQRELRGRPSFSTACKRHRPSKCGPCDESAGRVRENETNQAMSWLIIWWGKLKKIFPDLPLGAWGGYVSTWDLGGDAARSVIRALGPALGSSGRSEHCEYSPVLWLRGRGGSPCRS